MLRFALLVSFAAAVGACGDVTPGDDAPPAITYDAEATTAGEVAERMTARWEQRFTGVDTFAVEAGGLRMLYRVTPDSIREAEGGLDWFQIEGSAIGSAEPDPDIAELLGQQVPNVPRIAKGFTFATFGGLQTLGGRRGYVLSSDDPGAIIGSPGAIQEGGALAQTLRLLIDAETYDILEVLTTVRAEDLERPLTQRLVYEDFRTENGLTLPYTVRRSEEGMDQYVTDDNRMIQGGRLGMIKQRLEGEPSSPERDAELARVNAELAVLDGQPRTTEMTVDRVEVIER